MLRSRSGVGDVVNAGQDEQPAGIEPPGDVAEVISRVLVPEVGNDDVISVQKWAHVFVVSLPIVNHVLVP